MVRAALLLSIVTLVSTTAVAASQPPLVWCFDNLPPRQYYDAGKEPVGAMVELMKELAKRLDTELHYTVPTPTVRCLQQLEQGEVDIVVGLLLTPERQQQLYMFPFDSARPNSWFINQQYPLAAEQPLRLTLIKTQVQAAAAAQQLSQAGHQVHLAADFDTALTDLFFNKTDVVVGPEHITQKHIAQNGRYQRDLVLAPQEYQQPVEAHIAICKKGRFANRADEIQRIIQDIRASGRYQFY